MQDGRSMWTGFTWFMKNSCEYSNETLGSGKDEEFVQ